MKIITKQVVDNETGEVKSVDFKEVSNRKILRGGFRMVYPAYDEAVIRVVRSSKDYEILVIIRDSFTYRQTEALLDTNKVAATLKVSVAQVKRVVKRMKEADLIRRVSRGVYRLNPYMYLPYRSEAKKLQEEWSSYDLK
jgi:hypothetical protein